VSPRCVGADGLIEYGESPRLSLSSLLTGGVGTAARGRLGTSAEAAPGCRKFLLARPAHRALRQPEFIWIVRGERGSTRQSSPAARFATRCYGKRTAVGKPRGRAPKAMLPIRGSEDAASMKLPSRNTFLAALWRGNDSTIFVALSTDSFDFKKAWPCRQTRFFGLGTGGEPPRFLAGFGTDFAPRRPRSSTAAERLRPRVGRLPPRTKECCG